MLRIIPRAWLESILSLSRTFRRHSGGTWYKVEELDYGGWSTGRNIWTVRPLPGDEVLEREEWPLRKSEAGKRTATGRRHDAAEAVSARPRLGAVGYLKAHH